MLDILFFTSVALYLAAVILQFVSMVFKKDLARKLAFWVAVAAFSCNSGYMIARGIIAGRLPLSNQFEFATAFAWGIALIYLFLRQKLKQDWLGAVMLPVTFLMISYAALQPREINELMPALRSAWFALHIGCAVFSYAGFATAGCLGVRYLAIFKRVKDENDPHLTQIDYLSYRMIAFGFLLLTIVILSGCVWAEQAWATFWSWDPKETWALITWIFYAIYLHQRIRKKWQGRKMALFAVIAVICVLFTFIGVNKLLPGLHSYA